MIPCSADEPDEDNVRQALRGAVIRFVLFLFGSVNYRIYPCISRPFFTSKSVQKIVLDLYMGQNFRPKHQLNIFCTISVTIVLYVIKYRVNNSTGYDVLSLCCVFKLAVQVGIPYDLSA